VERERCHHRFPVDGARLRGPSFDAPVVNLSSGGLAIRTDSALAPGDRYTASLETESDRSQVEGWVAWRRPVPLGSGPERSPELPPLYEVGLLVEHVERAPRTVPGAAAPSREPIAVRSSVSGRSVPRRKASDMRLRADDLDAEVINLSSRGLAIETDQPLPQGQAYDARLEGRDRSVSLKAIVVWCVAKPGGAGEGGAPSPRFAAGLSIRGAARGTVRGEALPAQPEPAAAAATLPSVDDVAPWLAEVMAELEGKDGSAGGRAWRRRTLAAMIVVALGLLGAYWLSSRPAAEPAPTIMAPTLDAPPASPAVEAGALSEVGADERREATVEVSPPPARPAEVAALGTVRPRAGINVRRGPGLEFPIARTTEEGERLPYLSKDGEWFRLQGEKDLWIHESTVEGLGPATGVP